MKKLFAILLGGLTLAGAGTTFVACGEKEKGKDGHTHVYAEEWSHDLEYHWRDPICGDTEEIAEKAEHVFGEIIVDEEATPIKNGRGHKTCSVCDLTVYDVEIEYTADPNAEATLIFDVRGGESIAPITVKAGTTIDLSQYTVERTDGATATFEGWVVGGKKVESVVLTGDMVAHASYSCDAYMGTQSVKIGKYPQTVLSEQSVIEALDKMEYGDRNANGYYEYQGEEYARIVCGFDSNTFTYEKGKAYYFKVEPITWARVNGRWTTLQVLDFVDSYELLEYLNDDFYATLTEQEKEFVGDTKLNGEDRYKFFLWNVDAFEASHQSEADRKQSLTDYALFKDDTSVYKDDRFTTKYWLLNPLNDSGIDAISLYSFTGKGSGSERWEQDHSYMGKCGLLPCFNFDFKGIKEMTSDNTVRVRFNVNGGAELSERVWIAGEKYQLPTPEKEGFKFVGWYSEPEFKKFVSARDFSSEKDVELYAKWEEKPAEPSVYTITYELNGGEFLASASPANRFTEGEKLTFATPKKASDVSYQYIFDGWYLESDFQTKATSTEGLTNDVKLYAKWKAEGIYFYVEYKLESDESIVEAEYPTKVLRAEGSIKLPTAQKKNAVFVGWKERGRDELISSISTLRTGTVELTAYYARAYSITWELADGVLDNQGELPSVIYSGAPTIDFTALVPKKEGYKFLYWSVSWVSASESKFGTGYRETLSFENGVNLPTTSSTPTISAVFGEVYELKLVWMGGSLDGNFDNGSIEFTRQEGQITFKNPVKEGAKLLGWSKYSSCDSEAEYSDYKGSHKYFTVNADGTTSFDPNKLFKNDPVTWENNVYDFEAIYAIWDKITISFETNADGLTKESIVVGYQESVNLSDVLHALDITNDKKFGGWYLDKELTRQCSGETIFYTDTALYAKWLPKLKITLVYENGDSEEQYIYEGDTIESIKYSLKEGQYLGGVYLDEALTNKLTNRQLDTYKPKTDIVLYVVRKS